MAATNRSRSKGGKGRGRFTDADRETARLIQLGQNVTSVAIHLIRYGCYAFIAWQVVKGLEVLAGKDTKANIFLGLLADLGSKDRTVEGLLGTVILLLGFLLHREKKMRSATIQELGELRRWREVLLDPKRSSSRLTTIGTTRPEDEP